VGSASDDLLLAGSGNDVLRAGLGHDLLDAGTGNDLLYGDNGNDWLAGGLGQDTVYAGLGHDVIVFNRGDGQDTIVRSIIAPETLGLNADGSAPAYHPREPALASPVDGDTLSLGGIRSEAISLRKSGNDLVLELGNSTNGADQITLQDWYAPGPLLSSGVQYLQLVLASSGQQDTSSAQALLRDSVVVLDLRLLAQAFDAATLTDGALASGQASWSIHSNNGAALLASAIGSSSALAFGGELSWRYAMGQMGSLSASAAQQQLPGMGAVQAHGTSNTGDPSPANPWLALQAGIEEIATSPTSPTSPTETAQFLAGQQLLQARLDAKMDHALFSHDLADYGLLG
jgi:hypothetical protein